MIWFCPADAPVTKLVSLSAAVAPFAVALYCSAIVVAPVSTYPVDGKFVFQFAAYPMLTTPCAADVNGNPLIRNVPDAPVVFTLLVEMFATIVTKRPIRVYVADVIVIVYGVVGGVLLVY